MGSTQRQLRSQVKKNTDGDARRPSTSSKTSVSVNTTTSSAPNPNKRISEGSTQELTTSTQQTKRPRAGRPRKPDTETAATAKADSRVHYTKSAEELQKQNAVLIARLALEESKELDRVVSESQTKAEFLKILEAFDERVAKLTEEIDKERCRRLAAEAGISQLDGRDRSTETENIELKAKIGLLKTKLHDASAEKRDLQNLLVELEKQLAEQTERLFLVTSETEAENLDQNQNLLIEHVNLISPIASPRADEKNATVVDSPVSADPETKLPLSRSLSPPLLPSPTNTNVEELNGSPSTPTSNAATRTPERGVRESPTGRTSLSELAPQDPNVYVTPEKSSQKKPAKWVLSYSVKAGVTSSAAEKSFSNHKVPLPAQDKAAAEFLNSSSGGHFLPDLRPSGFERRFVSKTEVWYIHFALKDMFSLQTNSFHRQSRSEITYRPISIGKLTKTLPSYLKMGDITFSNEDIDTFKGVISMAVANYNIGTEEKRKDTTDLNSS